MLSYDCTQYNTSISKPIKINERNQIFQETLDIFYAHDVVITDRFHGVIFAVLCKKPCVVLRTIDHKLTSSIEWFKNVPFVKLAKNTNEIPKMIRIVLSVKNKKVPDWNKEYFDRLPKLLNLKK